MPEQALAQVDVAEESRYLFDAPSLQDVRGASAVLESLARFTLPSLARRRDLGGAGIMAGGRRYLATFPSMEAGARFLREARRTYQQRTGAVRLQGAMADVSAEDLVLRFGRRFHALRRPAGASAGLDEAQVAVYSPELRLCDSCRRFPASRRSGTDFVCRACANRRTHLRDQDARLAIPGYQNGLADAGEEDLAARPVWERLLRWLRDTGVRRSADAARDIVDLAARRLPDIRTLAASSGQYAVLIVEVSEFAGFIEYIADSQRALRASAGLNRLLDDALFEAIAPLARQDQPAVFNFEALVSGGDRLICLLPADVALMITARLLRTIESQSAAVSEGRRFSANAGIGIVPEGVTISAAALRAAEALTLAHRVAADAGQPAVRGSWRSTLAVNSVDPLGITALHLGEIERTLTHARSLRRHGVEFVQLQAVLPALADATGRLAWLTSRWTEPQRRALAAVARDLSIGSADAGAEAASRLWPAILHALSFVPADSATILSRPRPEAAPVASARTERSA